MGNVLLASAHHFFDTHTGIAILGILTTIIASLMLWLGRKIPEIFKKLDNIISAIMGEAAKPEYGIPERKGLIRQVEDLKTREDNQDTHIANEIAEIRREVKAELASIKKEVKDELTRIRAAIRSQR